MLKHADVERLECFIPTLIVIWRSEQSRKCREKLDIFFSDMAERNFKLRCDLCTAFRCIRVRVRFRVRVRVRVRQ